MLNRYLVDINMMTSLFILKVDIYIIVDVVDRLSIDIVDPVDPHGNLWVFSS